MNRPICPRCGETVAKVEEHEIRMQLVNASPAAPREAVDLHSVFHHRCAAFVWNAARSAWTGQDIEREEV